MIVRLTQWKPRRDVEREDALEAWERHADVVGQIPGLRRYVQHHVTAGPDGSEPPYAGLGEVWFDDETSARAALASTEWGAVVDDAMRFMDRGSIVVAWSDHGLVRTRS
jgi:uncharacterized protein (TIGR02118 family)